MCVSFPPFFLACRAYNERETGRHMQKKRQMSNGYTRCYKQPGNQALVLAGIVLVGLGVVLLFLCIPGWAWVALLGFVLICAGLVLLRLGKAGR